MNTFKYIQPKNLKDASAVLKSGLPESIAFAGGTDVLGMIKNGIASPDKVVNLKMIEGMSGIKVIPGKGIEIGALTALVEIAGNKLIKEKYTVLAQAVSEIASPQFRNIATLGGNLCQRPRCFYFRGDFHCLRKGGDVCYAVDGYNKYHCIIGGGPCYIVHPSDTAVALLALNASVSIYSGGKSKIIPMNEFFILPEKDHTKENVLQPGELVEKIIIPALPNGSRSKYIKVKERRAWDFAVVSIAAVVNKNGNVIKEGSVALGGVAPKPWLPDEINKKLKNFSADEQSLNTLSKELLKDSFSLEMNAYKITLARNLLKRILTNLSA